MRKFSSNTHVCINVITGPNQNAHVSFTELSGKGSVFYTEDEKLADAMTKHARFGKLFREVPIDAEAATAAVAADKEEPADDGAQKDISGLTQSFSNIEDAKDFLAERYGISRSKLRTRAAIEVAAKGAGVTIEWTE